MARFDGKRVLLLGGSAGIGLAAARAFAAEGAHLAITGRDPQALERAALETGAAAFGCDIGDLAAMKRTMAEAAAQLGGIDVLCVNAGIGGFATIPEVSEAFWDEVHRVNLKGCVFAMQAALPHLRDGGAIVVTGSIGATLAIPGNLVYASAKAGLRAAARIFAAELLPRRIRVNLVSPGPTDTEIFKRGASAEQVELMRALLGSRVPLQRMGEPEEIARAVLFLASDEASFINGVDLLVDGGSVELQPFAGEAR